MADRTFLTPVQLTVDLADSDGLTYWKQILPEAQIVYNADGESRRINFDGQYLTDLVESFKGGALDQTPFMLADADNKHTMDPERYRGETVDLRKFEDLPTEVRSQHPDGKGLWAKLKFDSKESADAVLRNTKLGVSARIREGYQRATDGKTFKRTLIHVLGTLNPRVTGMKGWTPAMDFSSDADSADILDLTTAAYAAPTEAPVTTKTEPAPKVIKNEDGSYTFPDPASLTDDDIDNLTGKELEAFLAQYGEGSEDEGEEPEPQTETPEPDLSDNGTSDIELANAAAANALAQAKAAQKRTADAEWKSYRSEQLRAGVPPHVLDLAQPVLNRFDEMVIDLSMDGDANVNASQIVRQLVEGYKGTIDLSGERGHGGREAGGDEPDPDAELMAMADNDPAFRNL